MGEIVTPESVNWAKSKVEVLGPKRYSSQNFKKTNHVAMTPDRGFRKQLKILDKELEVVWDWGSERWEIWKFPELRKPYMLMRVQTQSKDYKALGQDVLLQLQQHIQIGPEDILKYLEEHNNQLRRRKEKEFKDKIRDMALDAWGPLFTVSSQVPKNYVVEKPTLNKVLEVV